MPCLKEGCIGPRRAFPEDSTHLTYFPGGCGQVVPLPTGKSPLLCVDFQGHATFSRKTSKQRQMPWRLEVGPRQGFVLLRASCRPEPRTRALSPRAAPAPTRHQGADGAPPRARHLGGWGSALQRGRWTRLPAAGWIMNGAGRRNRAPELWIKPSPSQPAGSLPPP